MIFIDLSVCLTYFFLSVCLSDIFQSDFLTIFCLAFYVYFYVSIWHVSVCLSVCLFVNFISIWHFSLSFFISNCMTFFCLTVFLDRQMDGWMDEKTWLPPEKRLCSLCDLNQMETELHFLTECSIYMDMRTVFYDKMQQIHQTFKTLSNQEKLPYLFGEHKNCCVFSVQYVSACHDRRENTQSALIWCFQHM